MKRFFIIFALAALLGVSAASARDQWTIGDKKYDVDTLIFPHLVGPGVTSAKFDIPDLPLKVSVLEMDLTNPYMVMETCLGSDKSVGSETPVNMVTRNTRPGHEVVAATNGDFYMTSPTNEVGLPVSGQIRNGELVLSSHNRACLVLDENHHPFIDRLTFAGRVTCGETTFALNLVNRMRKGYEDIAANQSILFTRSYGPTTYEGTGGKMVLLRPAAGDFAWLANGSEQCVVESVFDADGTNHAIPDGQAILWLKGNYATKYADALAPGSELTIDFTQTLNNGPKDIVLDQLIGGSDHIIMQDGVYKEAWDERHPRTAIGLNADSTHLIFIVIDGRYLESLGTTLKEMVGIFEALGAVTAVNLDGGGSSCMVVNGEVINHPSDGPVRAVGNGCLLVSTAPEDEAIGIISYEPRCYNISISATTTFDVWGYNQYGVLKTRDLQGCTFSCDPQVGTFDADGVFRASATPAQGNLYVTYGDVTATQHVTIMPSNWVLESDSVVVDQFHPYSIVINGISGYSMDRVDPSVVDWTSINEGVCMVDEQGLITAVADGRTSITSDSEGLQDSLLVSVEMPLKRITTVENAPIDPATWTVTQSGGTARTVTALDNGLQIDFTGASSRNPYIKVAKQVRMWSIPDTLRLRVEPGNLPIKSVKVLVENAVGERTTVERAFPEGIEGQYTIDIPASEVCNALDMGSFPLHLVYYYFTYSSPVSGEQYSLRIPGMELVYAGIPPEERPATGDVNSDGEVNIGDVNAVIDAILVGTMLPMADVNGDGEVNIADVNAVIDLILR